MTIQQIVRNRKGSAGGGNAWRVQYDGYDVLRDGSVYTLWHYSTPMLTWCDAETRDQRFACAVVLMTCTGHGSVSDQKGMNKAFRTLDVPLYFSRKGGAQIVEVSR